MGSIYFDNNATTAVLPEVVEAMSQIELAGFGNPASQHEPGRRARRALEVARDEIATMLGAGARGRESPEVIFTSGGTESNNLALRGLAGGPGGRVVISAIEHPSVSAAAQRLAAGGCEIRILGVDENGVARLDDLPELLTPGTRLVSLMLGNNETGVLQPVRKAAEICRQQGILLHTDATQAVGKVSVDFRELGVDALTCAAHKFHGPRGIGILLIRPGLKLQPLFDGGFQQQGLRPGTESVALAVGMQHALATWHHDPESRRAHLASLRDTFEAALRSELADVVVLGRAVPRLPHTSNVAFPGLDRQALQMALDLGGLACSTGSACASGSSVPSAVLAAMGVPPEIAGGALRFSFGIQNTPSEVEAGAALVGRLVGEFRSRKTPGKTARTPPARSAKTL